GGQGWAGAFDPFSDLNCNSVRDAGEPFTDLNGNGLFDAVNAEAGLPARTTPPMANPYAARYLNNITRSIAATTSVPASPENLGMPGEYAATQFILLAALANLHSESDYLTMAANPGLNNCVASYTLANNVHNNAKYLAFNNAPAGKVPARKTGAAYNDGVANGANYIRQGSVATPNVAVSYGGDLNLRNKIAGDFNGSGARDAGDVAEMVKAVAQRLGGSRWNAPDGIYGAGAGEQAIIEVLGDFNGDGNVTKLDVRYFADGLFLVNGNLDRSAGFTAVDDAFGGNYFGTVLATGTAYENGDSAGDVTGSTVGPRKGNAPTGADGTVNAADIDYVFAQFKNSHIVDGQANWSDLNEAVYFDLSADLTGDKNVDDADICKLVTLILGTSIGDVNLDGSRDATDFAIAQTYRGGIDRAGGWANGDVDGDGFVTETDLGIIATGGCSCFCPADYNRDGGVDGGDIEAFFSEWEGGSGCADVNADGGIDGGDIERFFLLWEAGGC
ncbi:MAG: dockerin type I repeat-containing protein, partial [Planctomycetota bacterium]|nr:dockerin type I repeat-containing protein [Planctomycetota bacterium]